MNFRNQIATWGICLFALLQTAVSHAAPISKIDSTSLFALQFRFQDALLLYDYKTNAIELDKLKVILCDSTNIDINKIEIVGFASPDGYDAGNELLARARAVAVRGYLYWRYPYLKRIPVTIDYRVVSWDKVVEVVERDKNVPDRNKILSIVGSSSSSQDKTTKLKLLPSGAYKYLLQNIFSTHQEAITCVLSYKTELPKLEITESLPTTDGRDTLSVIVPDTVVTEITPAIEPITPDLAPMPRTKKPLFALKTNLLFDAATLVNLELEVPIGKRWSIAAEVILPWWLQPDKQRCIQMLSGNIEGKYWFGNREYDNKGRDRNPLTGWFAGLYAGGGYYDIEWNARGYQGEFFIAAGISGGYSHSIGRNLRMEYSLGVGYMQTNYRYYEAEKGSDNEWHLIRQRDGRFTWMGPTRAKVSLVWMINYHTKRGGGR